MTSMAGSAAAAARTAGVSQAAVDANQRLLDRIALLEEANAAGSGNGNDAIHNSTRQDTNTPELRTDRSGLEILQVLTRSQAALGLTTTSNTSRVTASPDRQKNVNRPSAGCFG